MRAQDLTGEAKEMYEEWRGLGYTERQALDRVQRSGVVRESELYDTFRDVFGLSREAASVAALGRDPEAPADDHERLVENFRGMGLSEVAAEVAADGRDGPSSRPVSESGGLSPAAAIAAQVEENGRRLIAVIESWADDIRRGERGGMAVERGESLEVASIRTAFGKVFLAIPDTEIATTGSWVLSVAEARWPWLRKTPGQPSKRTSESRPAGGKQSGSRSVTLDERVSPQASTLRRGKRG